MQNDSLASRCSANETFDINFEAFSFYISIIYSTTVQYSTFRVNAKLRCTHPRIAVFKSSLSNEKFLFSSFI